MKRSYFFALFTLLFLCIQSLPAQNIYSSDTWKGRDKWQNVPKILDAMGLDKGDVIADIGSHQGYMTFKFSRHVGDRGKVYAVDVNSSQLRVLDRLLEEQKIQNVETIKGNYDNPKLPENTLDYAFIMDAYHEMDDYKDILRHVRKALKPDGRLVILEPIAEGRRGLKRRQQEAKHEIDMHYVIEDLQNAGFEIVRQEDPFIDRSVKKNDQLWFLMAKKGAI